MSSSLAPGNPNLREYLFDLESSDESTRRAAIFSVARASAVEALPLLREIASTDPSQELQYLARKALNLIGSRNPEAVAKLRSLSGQTIFAADSVEAISVRLFADEPETRASALRAVAQAVDPKFLPHLLTRAAEESHPEVRSILVRVIAMVGGAKSFDVITQFLADDDPRTRANAVESLHDLRLPQSYPHIVKALQDHDNRVRTNAIKCLGELGKINVLECCQAMLSSEQPYWMRDSAAWLLMSWQVPDAIPLMARCLSDSQESVRVKARKGLEQLAGKGIEAAKQVIRMNQPEGQSSISDEEEFLQLERMESKPQGYLDTPVEIRRSNARDLADSELSGGMLPTLLSNLSQEPDPATLSFLLEAVGRIGSPLVFTIIREFLAHESMIVRAAAMDSILQISDQDELIAIVPLLKDSNAAIKAKAILALHDHPHIDVQAAIQELAMHAEVGHRSAAVYVISELGVEKFLGVLEGLTLDSEEGIAEMARNALPQAPGKATLEPAVTIKESRSEVIEVPIPAVSQPHLSVTMPPSVFVTQCLVELLGRSLTKDEQVRIGSLNASDNDMLEAIASIQSKNVKLYSSDQVVYEYEALKAKKKQFVEPEIARRKKRTSSCPKCKGTGYLLEKENSLNLCECKR